MSVLKLYVAGRPALKLYVAGRPAPWPTASPAPLPVTPSHRFGLPQFL